MLLWFQRNLSDRYCKLRVCTSPVWASAINSTDADWFFFHLYVKINLSWFVAAPCYHGNRVSLHVGNNETSLKMYGERPVFTRNRYTLVRSRIFSEPHVAYTYFNKCAEKCSQLSLSATKFAEQYPLLITFFSIKFVSTVTIEHLVSIYRNIKLRKKEAGNCLHSWTVYTFLLVC